MLLDFSQIPVEPVANMRGGEGTVLLQKTTQGPVKVMRGVLPPGATIGLHPHETNSEVISPAPARCSAMGSMNPWAPGPATTAPKAMPTAFRIRDRFRWSFSRWSLRNLNQFRQKGVSTT